MIGKYTAKTSNPPCAHCGRMGGYHQPDRPHPIEAQIAELYAAGWIPERLTQWRAPNGALYRGPHGAWKAMLAERGAAL